MEILTWNVQAGCGVDGTHSLKRIAEVVRTFGDPDVICLQEIAQRMPELDGGMGGNQVDELTKYFNAYTPVFGPGVDRAGEQAGCWRRFGNLVLSRLPILQCFRHPLPQPADPTVRHMPRQATEVVVDTGTRVLRVVTTHLEFHSQRQRVAQVARLRTLHAEACGNTTQPEIGNGIYSAVARPPSAVYCGDFNFTPESTEHAHVLAPFEDGSIPLQDAWAACNSPHPHLPTCGLADHQQWPEGAHCRDYFFVTADLVPPIALVDVAMDTHASDHQPLRLVLREGSGSG